MKRKITTERIPRPVKACICGVLVLVVAAVYYIALGCPTLTFTQEFHRAEKSNLVGPSQIVDRLDDTYYEFEKLIVGETESGICFFGRYGSLIFGGKHSGEMRYVFTYLEKTGDLTVAAAPNVRGSFWELRGVELPVYVFADHPDAVRAEISVTVTGEYSQTVNGEKITRQIREQFDAEAKRSDSGVFRFILDCDDENSGYALYALSCKTGGSWVGLTGGETTCIALTVRLFDEKDALILTREQTIGTAGQT